MRYSQNTRLISGGAALHYLLGRRYATLTVTVFTDQTKRLSAPTELPVLVLRPIKPRP